jgi:16S rRNA (cytosine967-C5)-methyltransferase
MSAVSPARKAAFQILMAVERGNAHSDDLLRCAGVNVLSTADRHLATALVLGVLRWQIRIDHALQALLKRPGAKLDAEIRIALRLGAFQILHMDRIPARAAIDESVEIAKQAGHRFAAGMVNAVLRNLAAMRSSIPEEGAATLALSLSHPKWMVDRWVAQFGSEATRAICEHGQRQPATTIRVIEPGAEVDLADAGIDFNETKLVCAARLVNSGDIASTAAFKEGRVRIQDEGSQLVAEIAAQGSAGPILDCCAAPGGKTLILAERNRTARILACESSEARMDQLSKRVASFVGRVECRLGDVTELSEESEFDVVLADVPCSGTGTLGRNPEIRHRLQEGDLMRQAERQRRILAAALRAARPSGSVVYSTCSLEPEENEQVVAAVLAENSNARVGNLRERLIALAKAGVLASTGAERLQGCITGEGFLRLMPDQFDTDGFFVALLEKRS